jgi:hypothetical protein
MLQDVLGIRLLLWTGSFVPTPRPEVMAALRSVTVTNDADSGDGFQLTFDVSRLLIGSYDVLASGAFDLMNRVWIAAVIGVVPQVLIDGIVTRHDVQASDEPGRSTLTVTGTDLTVKLDLEERNEPHSNQPDSVIVAKRLGSYGQLGLIPAVTATNRVPIETDVIPNQADTDLGFIRRAARRNGFVFYIEPKTLGVNVAYWGPVVRAGIPQPALTVGMGGKTNVDSLSFSNDSMAPIGASGAFVEPFTKTNIPIPSVPVPRIPPLAARPTPVMRTTLLRETAKQGADGTLLESLAAGSNAPDAVRGSGELDAARYGAVLRARQLVGVRGAGIDHDGLYYVRSVTHQIERGSYRQRFDLSREGTVSTVPLVPT